MLINPADLFSAKLGTMSQGLKSRPVLQSDPREKLIDATHADINMGSFFKKLITCKTARIQTWEIRQDVKGCYENAEKMFDDHLLSTLGLGSSLMMPGNFARALFDLKNNDIVLQLIEDEQRREKLKEVFVLFSHLRSVYRAHHPKVDEVKVYKVNAINMGKPLKTHFAYMVCLLAKLSSQSDRTGLKQSFFTRIDHYCFSIWRGNIGTKLEIFMVTGCILLPEELLFIWSLTKCLY